jgi:cellulose synthase operon protein C
MVGQFPKIELIQPSNSASSRIVLDQLLVPCRLKHHHHNNQPGISSWWIWDSNGLEHLREVALQLPEKVISDLRAAIVQRAGAVYAILQLPTDAADSFNGFASGRGYTTCLGFNELLIPTNWQLKPRLRREFVREQITNYPDQLIWLEPKSDGSFQLQTMEFDSLQPLRNWLQYHTIQRKQVLMLTELDCPFAMLPIPIKKLMPPKGKSGKTEALRSEPQPTTKPTSKSIWGRLKQIWSAPESSIARKSNIVGMATERAVEEPIKSNKKSGFRSRLQLVGKDAASRARQEVQKLELQLLKQLETDSSPFSAQTWATLAILYETAGNADDASACWLRALWSEAERTEDWAYAWLESEAKSSHLALELDASPDWLDETVNPERIRMLAAMIVWASRLEEPVTWLVDIRLQLQRLLEQHESWLPSRAVWLSTRALSECSGGDELALARTRDRLLDRFTHQSHRYESDLPAFLRFNSQGISERFREARAWLLDHRDLIHDWVDPPATRSFVTPTNSARMLQELGLQRETVHTRLYLDLIIAWGLARLGDSAESEALSQMAFKATNRSDLLYQLLETAWRQRLDEARERRSPAELNESILRQFTKLPLEMRYTLRQLLMQTTILEPFDRRFERFPLIPNKREWLLPDERLRELITQVEGFSGKLEELSTFRETWSEALHLAVTTDQRNSIQLLIQQFLHWLDEFVEVRSRLIADLSEDLFRACRQVNLRAELSRLPTSLASKLLNGESLLAARTQAGLKWPTLLRGLTHIAGSWYYLGQNEDAHTILEEVRRELFEQPGGHPRERAELAIAYLGALSLAPLKMTLGRIEELLMRLKNVEVSSTTDAHFNLVLIRIVEKLILALVHDEFRPGPKLQRWLDEDEFNLRQRIHREVLG